MLLEEIVSRETIQKFQIYYDLLVEWNRRTSLVQLRTLDDFYQRHILDSLQLVYFLKDKNKNIVDIGTGAGFPGMVLAICGFENTTLIESNHRKTVFLQEIARLTNVQPVIINNRIEKITPEPFDFVLSRACAPLVDLLKYMNLIVSRETIAQGIFLKGEKVQEEIEVAKKKWNFDYELTQSKVDKRGWIIEIHDLVEKDTH